ncbi:MAG: aminoacyl-tRNA hydrolase [Actinomycetia bacterium]|nr:aminoacyl-tRNA hydrolase [Actinomycetes bacterium]
MLKGRGQRTGTPADLLVVGLGNPGPDYERSRHNVGADVVALLAERHGGRLRDGHQRALCDEVRVGEHRLAIAFPLTFYNESGDAVNRLVRRYGIDDFERVVIVHDEMDLEPGRVKLKLGGGLAGNNGLKSVRRVLGTDDFARIRIGIGKPPGQMKGADHVLRRPGKAERTELDIGIEVAADAVESILSQGIEATMNTVNTRR